MVFVCFRISMSLLDFLSKLMNLLSVVFTSNPGLQLTSLFIYLLESSLRSLISFKSILSYSLAFQYLWVQSLKSYELLDKSC